MSKNNKQKNKAVIAKIVSKERQQRRAMERSKKNEKQQ